MGDGVNLDALIPREDFLASEDGIDVGEGGKGDVSCTDLSRGESFYLTLRKPDFQRETAAWSPEGIRDFIEAFIQQDLIPTVIMWQSPSRLSFAIDGAHRLSAIMAWIQNDYGDGEQSIKFYNNKIPDKQRKLADKTRNLIKKTVGDYKDLKAEAANPGSNPILTQKARSLAFGKIPLLWIKSTDSKKAERAFFVINQSAVTIDPTELTILNSRFKPNSIAARAIVKDAAGHKYWEKFSTEGQKEIETVAQNVHKLLYIPPLQSPVRTIELPIAGHGYGAQTLPLVFNFVNIANNFPVIDPSKTRKSSLPSEQEKPDEEKTVDVLQKSRKSAQMMTGTHPSSLGLHPAIYFYSANGRHQPTSVLAVTALLNELEQQKKLIKFMEVRAIFEQFLIEHKMFVNQITVKHGSMAKGYRPLKEYYAHVLNLFIEGKTIQEVSEALKENEKYRHLSTDKVITNKSKAFSQDVKQLVFLKNALEKVLICPICNSAIDPKSMHLDHEKDKKDGGLGNADNARWTHPFCDSTFKDYLKKSAT